MAPIMPALMSPFYRCSSTHSSGVSMASTSSSMTTSVSCPLRFSSQARRNRNLQRQRQRHVYLPFSSRSSMRQCRRHIHLVSATSSSSGGPEDPSEGLSGILKSIRANLPVVGLVSALTAPEGGVLGEIGYSEYSRTLYSNAPPGFGGACASLSERCGKGANFRNLKTQENRNKRREQKRGQPLGRIT